MLTRRAKAFSSSCSQIALVYLQPFHRNSLLKCAAQPKIAKKTHETLYFWSSGFFKVIDFDTTKSSSLGLVVISSVSMPICNRFHGRLAKIGKITTIGGTALWCPCVQVSLNLEGEGLKLWNLRSMLKILYAACLRLSVVNSAQFALEICHAAQNRQKIHKTYILPFKVIQSHWVRWQSRASVQLPISN